jgi:DNA-binding transcriptional LysR family regulator
VVLGPASHPWSGLRQIPFADLADVALVMREEGSGTRTAVEQEFQKHGLSMRVKLELGSNEAIKQAVAGGLGLTILSRDAVRVDLAQPKLIELDVDGFPLRRFWYVVWPRGRQLSVVAAAFLVFLRENVEFLAGLPGSSPPAPTA